MHESGRDPAIHKDKGQLCYRETRQAHSEIEDTAFVGRAFACQCKSVSIRVDGETGIRWEEGEEEMKGQPGALSAL
jgi:hypothetical protein